MSKPPAIGIDLGTTNSCVAVYLDGQIKVIRNEFGDETMPSYVAFYKGKLLVGKEAKDQIIMNPNNTLYGVKRLIGRKFNDPSVQNDLKKWSYKVEERDSNPVICVNFEGEEKKFDPEEISSKVIAKLKNLAEKELGMEVHEAVITVPSSFNDSQREATKDASIIAGLKVLKLLVEPTAAAIAYAHTHPSSSKKNVLIFDLGGGTFDVSIVTIDKDECVVKSTDGDSHLGGDDFDIRMVDYFVDQFERRYYENPETDPRSMRRLQYRSEMMKRLLSTNKETTFELDQFYNGIDFLAKMTRECFEDINVDLFASAATAITRALEGAKMKKTDIDDVVIVGGSTRIPMVQAMLRNYFDNTDLKKNVHPDVAVAYGAAIQAAILSEVEGVKQFKIGDVMPFSISVTSGDNKYDKIFEKNTPIPASYTKAFINNKQQTINIDVYEGEQDAVLGKFFLGHVKISGPPKNVTKVEVNFVVDKNGILSITSCEKTKNSNNTFKIDLNKMRPQKKHQGKAQEKALETKDDTANLKTLLIKKHNNILKWLEEKNDLTNEEHRKKIGEVFDVKTLPNHCSK